MARNLPIIFGQTDYDRQLGTTGGAIKDFGCYLTTFANLARACGKTTDPIELNKALISKNLYIGGRDMVDDNLTHIYPDIIYQQAYIYPNATPDHPAVPADLNFLRELMADPTTWVILEISLPYPPHTHFVLCAGINGVVSIADPMTKSVIDFASKYGDPATNIIKFVIYKGQPVTMEDGLADQFRQERDKNWDLYLQEKTALEKMQSQMQDMQNQLNDLKGKYDKDERTIIDLKSEMAAIQKEDADYAAKAYDADKLANKRLGIIKETAGSLGHDTNKTDDDLRNVIMGDLPGLLQDEEQLQKIKEQQAQAVQNQQQAQPIKTNSKNYKEPSGLIAKFVALFLVK